MTAILEDMIIDRFCTNVCVRLGHGTDIYDAKTFFQEIKKKIAYSLHFTNWLFLLWAIAVVKVILIEPFFELFTFENHNASMAVVGAFVGFFTAGLFLLKTQKYE